MVKMCFKILNTSITVMFRSPSMDNFVFKLCYGWTVLLLVVFSSVVTCRLAFGNSFACTSNDYLETSYVNLKCYADSVYTLPSKLVIHKDVTKPSMDNFRKYLCYYSWVNLVFLLVAFNFYLPRLFWKSYESGYVYKLTSGLQKYNEEERGLEFCYLAKYVLETIGKHKRYTVVYIFFEACNYAIALLQTLALIYFFSVTGVPDFLPFELETWSDFRQFYFPPSGICDLRMFSASGATLHSTTMCEMPLNELFMYMFLFLHAWFIFITILTGLVLVYRIALLVPSFRFFVFKFTAILAERSILKSLCNMMTYSDWFFLTRLQQSMDDADFAQLIDKISVTSQGNELRNEEDKSSILGERVKNHETSAV